MGDSRSTTGATDADAAATHEALERYHARIAAAEAAMPQRRPWLERDRRDVRDALRDVLRVRDAWTPSVALRSDEAQQRGGLAVRRLRAETWPQTAAAAVLWRPDSSDRPRPAVLLCCGHGGFAKLNPTYQRMAIHLARAGANVLAVDNVGQGEREPMGHRRPWGVFACGLTVQGLIIMEAVAWLRWLREQPWADAARTAAIGNSGGGALTMTLAALDADLACAVSSGHPSSQAYTCRKERALCACALWPGVAGRLEMWELLACFAPRPLMIFQGRDDCLFPADHFRRVARRVAFAYTCRGAAERFRAELLPGPHPWDDRRIVLAGEFLAAHLHLAPASAAPPPDDPAMLAPDETCFPAWPDGAATTEDIARRLASRPDAAAGHLWDVFPPDLPIERVAQVTGSHDTRQVLAQLAAFLDGWREPPAGRAPKRTGGDA
jgi:dienelactone hydrolase